MRAAALLISYCLLGLPVWADEELWIPIDLSDSLLQELGVDMEFSFDQLYSDSAVSLTDAVVQFGGGCTGSFISSQGLVLTNQHCGRYYIQQNSTVEDNILKNGFYAKTRDEERICAGLELSQLVAMVDVTDSILTPALDTLNAYQQSQAIKDIRTRLEQQMAPDGFKVDVKAFDYGRRYIAFRKKIFHDVRLVANPPEDVGSFGGDLDNWVWPRHSADFALFRVYVDSLGQDVPSGQGTQPLSPDTFLTIGQQPVQQGDTTMILGYPWSTSNFMPPQTLDMILNKDLPARIELRTLTYDILGRYMEQDEANYLKLISRQSSLANAHKKWQGQVVGMSQADAVNGRKEQIDALRSKLSAGSQKLLDSLMLEYDQHYQNYWPIYRDKVALNEFEYSGSSLMKFAGKAVKHFEKFPDAEGGDFVAMTRTNAKRSIPEMELQILVRQWDWISERLDPELKADYRKVFVSTEKLEKWASRSLIADSTRLIEKYKQSDYERFKKTILKEKFIKWYLHYDQGFQRDLGRKAARYGSKSMALHKALDELWEEGLGKKKYANANGTFRVNFGHVEGYIDRNGDTLNYFTTIDGVMDKLSSGLKAYEVADTARALFDDIDAQYNGVLCFSASHHTSGGNSGSPVLNRNGELVGLNFDRAWESTMSDYWFDQRICRNISTDFGYIQVILKINGMEAVLHEMGR